MNPNSNKDFLFHISASSVAKAVLIVALFYALFVLRDLVLVVLTAVLIASAIEPLTRWLGRRKIPRVASVLMIYLGALVFLMGAFYFLFLPLVGDITEFIRTLPSYISDLEAWSPFGGEIGEDGLGEAFTVQEIISRINETIASTTSGILAFLSAVSGGVLSFIIIIVLSFYLAVQENGVAIFLRAITPLKYEEYVLDLWGRAEKKIGYWAQGQIILAIFVGVLVYLGLFLLGVPYALLLAVLAAIFELIPLFGPILAAVPAILVAFIEGGIVMALLVVGLYVIIQQFESQVVYPLLVRKMIGISPIVVIIALIAGYKLAGFLGILLSAPIAAVIMELFKDYEKKKHAEAPPTLNF